MMISGLASPVFPLPNDESMKRVIGFRHTIVIDPQRSRILPSVGHVASPEQQKLALEKTEWYLQELLALLVLQLNLD